MFIEYKESRGDWEDTYRNGLELLGFKYERRTEPFRGASGVNHPVLAEAVTQFQAQAYKELLPADGPVRTQIMGTATVQKEEQAKRVKDFMNYQIMDQMKEYEPEFDQMLFYLPLSGSTFKKVYYDSLLGRAVSKFVPADDLIVPYSANSLEDAEAVIHVIKISENELKKQQVNGFYRDSLHDTRSSFKSITSLLAGIAIDQGQFKVEDEIEKFIPEWKNDPRGKITVKNDCMSSSDPTAGGFFADCAVSFSPSFSSFFGT